MTKRRAPLTFSLALTRIAGLLGWDEVAAIAGVAPRTARNWTDPDTDPSPSTALTLGTAVALDTAWRAAGGDGSPLLCAFALKVETALGDGCGDQVRLAKSAARAAHEGGEAIQALVLASIPGAGFGAREHARRETEEAIAALTASLNDLGEDDQAPDAPLTSTPAEGPR